MLLAIFVLVLLTSMGMALLFTSQNETRMSQASLRVKQAFYMAEAGLEDGRRTLYDINGGGLSFTARLQAAAGPSTTLNFDRAALAPVYDSSGQVTGLTGFGDDVPLRALTATGQDGWYAAFLTNDPTEGRNTTTDGNGRVMITAIGGGRDRSVEVIEAILAIKQTLPIPPAAALTLLGPSPSFDNGNSNAQSNTGSDCAETGDGTLGLYVPIVGTIGTDALDDVLDGMNKPNTFSSGAFSGGNTVGDLTNASNPIVAGAGQGTIVPSWTECASLKEMLAELAAQADYYCTSSCSVPGGTSWGDVIFANGNLTVSGGPHRGILVVTGTLTMEGSTTWEGTVLVIGEGRIQRYGNGNGYISGSMIVANIAGTDGIYGTNDDCTGGADGFGSATYETSGGGSGTVTYCSTHLAQANPVQNYRIVDFVQR